MGAAGEVEKRRQEMPAPDRTFIFSPRFHMLSQLGVHLDPATVVTTLTRRPDQYRVWFDAPAHRGWDALLVEEAGASGSKAAEYKSLFDRVESDPAPFEILRSGRVAHRLLFHRCYGYRGELTGSDAGKEGRHR
jgi:hypothetical protein